MWGASFFRSRPTEPKQADRMLFRFFDGVRERTVDPIPTYRAIRIDPEFDEESHIKEAESGNEDAWDTCLRAVQRAFNVKSYNGDTGEGLTQLEQMALLTRFYEFFADLKKNTETSLTSQPSTGSMSQTSSPPTTSATSLTGS